ncbi:MAG: calcium/sodium antiporter [Spirochaetaceae bacterium]
MLIYILFLLGFPLLIGGAYATVRGASTLALKLGISELVIGMTVVAFGTSAPELLVSTFAAFKGSPDVGTGNIIGSNLSNLLLIIGIASLITPLKMQKSIRRREIPFTLLATLILLVLVNDTILNGTDNNSLNLGDGIVLLGFFSIYLYYIFSLSKAGDEPVEKVETTSSIPLALLFLAAGIAGLGFGGQWLVDGASTIAARLGMSEALIGLTVVALGTSLPELATSVTAALRGQPDMAIGNVVGSNVFNILWILGFSSVLHEVGFNISLNIDLLFLIFVTLLFFLFTFTGKKHQIGRVEGGIFLLFYALYIVFVVVRG